MYNLFNPKCCKQKPKSTKNPDPGLGHTDQGWKIIQ